MDDRNLCADLASATAKDIEEIRLAFQVQRETFDNLEELVKRFYKTLVTCFPSVVAQCNDELHIEFLNFKSVNKEIE